ncbi:MAG: hypothetical protein HKO56_05360 [Bacteroidia bacterium]|nr:hypothetical protein [Bacteroidia bacterium]NNC85166.1 hypothetical protein [Bacteroidia bacterium]NNM16066.1 hypothetical protein [Bacteroidia bacterium]
MKKVNYSNAILALFTLTIGACATPDFVSNDFKTKTSNHKTIAVLPVQMIFSGKQPKGLTPEQIIKIEDGESRAFQISLYNNLLKQSGPKKKDIQISIQTVERTNRILEENEISIRQSWTETPESLAKTLGVDAVIQSKVEKTRYMSDLASFGIDLGVDILEGVMGYPPYGVSPVPYGISKTHDIRAECSLFNGSDGTLLYKDKYVRATDYNVRANEMIEHLTKKFSKTFPYRDK